MVTQRKNNLAGGAIMKLNLKINQKQLCKSDTWDDE